MKKGLRQCILKMGKGVIGSAQRPDEEGIKTTALQLITTNLRFGTET